MKKIVILLVIILIIAAAGLGSAFYLTNGKLGTVQAELRNAQNTIINQKGLIDNNSIEISGLQAQLEARSQEAIVLQSQLDVKNTELGETNDQLSQTKSLVDQTNSEKNSLTLQLNSYKDGFNNTKLQLQTSNKELADAQSKIQLMKDTFGDVSAGILPKEVITDGTLKNKDRVFNLKRNPSATNPTWDQLITFFKTDYTDQKLYVDGLYTCGNYAEDVFNNAEAAGIRTAIVCIDFKDDDEGHAINAFKTTDEGLVYIDCTGDTENTDRIRMVTEAYVEIGEDYWRDFIFPCDYYFEPDEEVTSISIFW